MAEISALINSHPDPLLRKILQTMHAEYKAAFDSHGHKDSVGYTSKPSSILGQSVDDADAKTFPE